MFSSVKSSNLYFDGGSLGSALDGGFAELKLDFYEVMLLSFDKLSSY